MNKIKVQAATMFLCGALSVWAQETRPVYDGLQASAEAYARSYARGLDQVRQQISLIDQLRWSALAQHFNCPCNACRPPFGYGTGLTEDLWPTPQPIGRLEIRPGPNRHESHPLYASPPPPPVVAAPQQPKMDRFAPAGPPKSGPREF